MKRMLFATLGLMVLVTIGSVVVSTQRQPAQAGGPTSGAEMQAPFDLQYFLGEWEVEWTPPDTPLLPGGMYTGTETVTHINSRFLKIDIELEGEQGNTLTGQGILLYDWGLGGQSMVRHVVYDAGFSLLQYGALGGDLGGYYSAFWDTPEFEFNEHTITLTGRSYLVSPAAYRVNQQISVDGRDPVNFGIMWLTKEMSAPGEEP